MQKAAWTRYFGAAGIAPETVEAASLITRSWAGSRSRSGCSCSPAAARRADLRLRLEGGTELLRLVTGEPFWEFVERGGSYAAPFALLYVRRWTSSAPARTNEPTLAGDAAAI